MSHALKIVQSGYDDSVARMQERLAPFIPERDLPAPRWISTPDGDLGSEWCSDCGYYKVRNLRRRDRKRAEDYTLDGGWRTEEEHFCFCTGCGTRLNVCLLEYGVIETIENFEQCGFSTDPGEDAYEIGEVLSALEYRSADEKPDTAEQRRAILAIAKRFLSLRRDEQGFANA